MLKLSEIIRMAINHPSYLNGRDWLCDIVWVVCLDIDIQNANLAEQTQSLILDSLGSSSFLRRYLIHIDKITSKTSYQSQEYKQPAFEHWNKLIEKLEKEGK